MPACAEQEAKGQCEPPTASSITSTIRRKARMCAVSDMYVGISNDHKLVLKSMREKTNSTKRKLGGHSPLQFAVKRVICNPMFKYTCAFAITMNVISICAEADFNMNAKDEVKSVYFEVSDIAFTAFFCMEMVLRVAGDGTHFFAWFNPDLVWNLFDLFVVMASVLEEVLDHTLSSTVSMELNVAFLRALRIFRLLRVFRIIRVVCFFSELRVLVEGIKGSLTSLVWCVSLIVLGMFICSVLLLQLLLHEYSTGNMDVRTFIEKEFGSVGKAMYTLHTTSMAGRDWAEISDELFKMNTIIGFIYISYIAFAMLCVFNIITGLFVDKATSIMQSDAHYMQLQDMQQQHMLVNELAIAFVSDHHEEWDGVQPVIVTAEGFENHINDDRVQAYLRRIGIKIDKTNARCVFNLVDFDEDGKVDLEDLVAAFRNLSGAARQLTVAKVEEKLKCQQKLLQKVCEDLGLLTERTHVML
eukprot:NODE_291_length_1696_cov_402.357099.p1 GENE.NODE_291_length_1696_cov_402.357099~~NODE_291_length_1696_cov_402.357099.p1  ORF type:complete len:542 (+),score=180.17 NODE_291_length_1696_cov_402.357099:215-1627(+)